MFDWVLTPLALLHALLLIGAILWCCRRLQLPGCDWPFVAYILFWTDLVLAGHVASIFHALDQLTVYVPVSFAVMGGVLALYMYLHRLPTAAPLLQPPQLRFTVIDHLKSRRLIKWFLLISLGVMVLATFAIGFSVYPDNADSMIYRLPRAFWYVSNGSFLHPFDAVDKRITFYPLDGIALYVPLVLYNLPGITHSYPSLITWVMLFYTTYRFARALGAEQLIAFFAAWLVVVTPGILAQATSTNDEILTSTVLLTGLFMAWRWLISGKRSYFFLALTAVGLSIGTKLHIVFLMPIILIGFALAIWEAWRRPVLWRQWYQAIGWRAGSISIISMLVMALSFLVYNYLSVGRFYNLGDFAHDVFNWQASLHGALQNLLIYTSQMTLSPIADLDFWPVANDRQRFNLILNAMTNPIIAPFINLDPKFYHFTYRFHGVTIPTSVRFVEFSLWSGFVWLLWPWQTALALRQYNFSLRRLFFLIALAPALWLLLWSCSTLYMEGTATYFTYYLVCAAPSASFAFAAIRRPLWSELRWVVIIFVALTNLLIGTNLLMFSGFRAIPDLFYAHTWPFDWDLMDQPIIDAIRHANRIRIVVTHEKMPYFAFMHWHPKATYYSPYPLTGLPEPQNVLQLMPAPSDYNYGFMPLKIPGKATAGMTYLGTMRGIGREVVFGMGDRLQDRYPDQSNYIVPHVTLDGDDQDGYTVSVDPDIAGLRSADNLEFSYTLKAAPDTVLAQRGWSRDTGFTAKVAINPREYLYKLTIAVRSGWSHKELTQATYQLYGPGSWLPAQGEY